MSRSAQFRPAKRLHLRVRFGFGFNPCSGKKGYADMRVDGYSVWLTGLLLLAWLIVSILFAVAVKQ